MGQPRKVTMTFEDVGRKAGFAPGLDGKLNLPVGQEVADLLGAAAAELLGDWSPGDPTCEVTLTRPGPIWGYGAILHALHGRARKVTFCAPNAPNGIVIWRHGCE